MRQSGILCSAALVGLDMYRDQFSEDHKNANKLAELLNDIDGFNVDMGRVETNLVFVDILKSCADVSVLQNELREKYGILIAGDKYGGNHPSIQNVRFVTHRDISSHDVLDLVNKIKDFLSWN